MLNLVLNKFPKTLSEFSKAILESLLIQFAIPWFGLLTIFDEDNKENYDKYLSMKVSEKKKIFIITFLINFKSLILILKNVNLIVIKFSSFR